MAGYTRQSSADITAGATVRAAPINAELNQVLDAFSNTTGHKHDGSTAEGPVIGLIGDAGETAPNNKVVIDTSNNEIEFYVEVSGNPVEQIIIKDGVIEPTTDDDIDLGSTGKQFKDLHLDGTANIDSLIANTADIDGGTIDGVTIGGSSAGAVTTSSLVATTADINGGTLDGVTIGGSSAGAVTTSSLVATTADINAGTIDGTDIGGSSRAGADFTNLTANGTISFSGGTVSNLGSVTTADINGGTIDGVTIGTNSAVTDLRVDNLKLDANTISATNTNGSITLTPNGTGSVVIGAADINGGAIDGTPIGAASASTGGFTTLTTSGQATLATADINGGTADNVVIGGSTRAAGSFTTLSANAGITGDLTGNVTGNITGNIIGNITGDITGDVTGNVTASSGTTTLNNLTVNGTANFTSTALTNVVDPSNAQDAATKNYVDTQLAGLVDSAPGTLNTLNEIAAAIGDDANFSTTITNSIATKLPLAGGTMSGAIAMGSSKITGLGTPAAGTDAATKAYADTKLPLAGGTMSGNIAMGSNTITGLPTPSASNEVATKGYVDTTNASNTAAASSAAAAATSETNAATSETNAATSAANALSSANSAAASYDLFDDRFLGAKSSAPSVDNDGDALQIGSLYFDSTTDTMKVYGSGGWVAAGSTVNGTSQRKTYAVGTNEGTYTGSTTVFPIAYDAGFIDVYHNGIKLDPDNDFTASNGTSVTLASAAASGDIVDMVAYGTFQLANFSVGDANNVDLTGHLTGHVLTYDGTNYVPSDQGRTIHLGGDGSNDGVSVSDGAISMRTGTGSPAYIDMYCEVSNAHKVTIKAPAHANYSGNVNFTLPGSNGTNGQFLQTDGSGNLTYATVAQPSNATTGAAGLMSAADKTKMDGIEASADVTDTANVTSAGALMTTGGTMSGNVDLNDNVKARFGAGNDLQIYHDASHSYIVDDGTGNLYISTNGNGIVMQASLSELMFVALPNGAVTLYHDNAAKLATKADGVDITGELECDTLDVDGQSNFLGKATFNADVSLLDNDKLTLGFSDDLQLYHDGSDSYMADVGSGSLYIGADSTIALTNAAVTTTKAQFITGGAVKLFHDNAQKFETTSTGIDVTGAITTDGITTSTHIFHGDNVKGIYGSSNDLEIYHSGSISLINDQGTGVLELRTNGTDIRLTGNSGSDFMVQAISNGAVKLFHDNTEKAATAASGFNVSGNLYATGLIGKDGGDHIEFVNNTRIDFLINGSNEFRMESDGDFHADGNIIAYSSTISDPRLKENVAPVTDALDKVEQLTGYTFTYKPDGVASAGVMSTDVQSVLPSAVKQTALPLKTGEQTKYDVVQYDQLHALLIEAVKELSQRVKDLEDGAAK